MEAYRHGEIADAAAGEHLVAVLGQRAARQAERRVFTFLRDGERDEIVVTYAELDARARAIAAAIAAAGVREQARALLMYAPGIDYIAGLFGCLYAGVVAVPAYPPEPGRIERGLPRLRAIAADAGAAIALTSHDVLPLAEAMTSRGDAPVPLRWIATDRLAPDTAKAWRPPRLDADSLAILQYTSGSTGEPRGVMLTHGNLLHNSRLIRGAFGIDRDSVGVLWLPPYHDMGLVGGILQPIVGDFPMTLMAPMAFLQRPMRWLEAVSRLRATVSGGPNFAFDLCLRKSTPAERARLDLRAWRTAFSGAEPVRHETIERFASAFGDSGFRRQAFYPCYGLAEATLIVSGGDPAAAPSSRWFDGAALASRRAAPCDPGAAAARPLVGCGRSLGEQELAIVDPDSGERCAPDRVGEIWVRGRSVAQGYWRAPELSERTFAARLPGSNARYLRTGDLGFVLDGELFIAGRLKDLIIARGRNLYPQDVEHTVEQAHPGIRPGSGAAIGVEHAGEERLVIVYEVNAAHAADPGGLGQIREAIHAAVVAAHQIAPHAIVLVKPGSIAKTSSGKIQRHACRAAFVGGTSSALDHWQADAAPPVKPGGSDAAATATAAAAAAAWIAAQVARLTEQRVDDLPLTRALSACGLDSLSAVELQYEIEAAFGVCLAPAELLDGMTLQELVARLEARDADRADRAPATIAPATVAPATAAPPASFAQERTWFFAQLDPSSSMYNLAGSVRLRGRLDAAALGRAIDHLVARHASLRTTLPVRDGRLVQDVATPSAGWLEVTDLTGGEVKLELERRVHEAAAQPFDLARGPLFRARLFRLGDGEHALLLAAHHAIADGRSLRIFLSELAVAYRAFAAGEAPALPAPAAEYADFAAWQRAQLGPEKLEELLGYWRAQLAELPAALELPTDHQRPPVQRFRGALHRLALPAALIERLAELARAEGATRFMVLLSGFAAWLGHCAGQDEIVIGVPVGGRPRPELERVIGLFVNTVPIRVDLRGAPSLRELCRRVRRVCLEAYRHQELPFDKLVEVLAPERRLDRSPICQAMLALQGVPEPFELGGELAAEASVTDTGSAQFDLALGLSERGGGLEGALEYDRDLFEADTIARWARHLGHLLARVAAEPDRSLGALSCLDDEERELVVRTFNRTPEAAPEAVPNAAIDEPLIHRMFERQAARTPAAIAIELGEQRWSYAELDAEAERLARRLRAAGAGPERRVAVCLDRTPSLPAALLAVLKAGAAYVPLDPSLPRARLQALIEDAAPVLLVTEAGLADACPFAGPRVLIDERAQEGAQEHKRPGPAPAAALDPDAAAYVIYTSGSTGRPKGVVATHRGVCNHLAWYVAALGLGPIDRVLQKYSVSFDASVAELFAPLVAGARVVMASAAQAGDAAALARLLAARDVTVADFVPALLELVIDEPAFARCAALRHLVCGGETLPPELIARARARTAAALHNMYGPTEATIGATAWTVADADARRARVPIGRPVANTQVYVLSRELEPVPIGVVGELCIGGAGVTRGYLGRPGPTATRFVPDPFSARPGARLYRTGDRGRWLPDGALELAGRDDDQIKLRGFRVELGEIESVLRQHPDLLDVLVIAEPDDPRAQPTAAIAAAPAGARPPDVVARRSGDFELSLSNLRDGFLRPPREAQRNWLLRRALDEAADDLVALDRVARRFVRGSDRAEIGGAWQRSRAAYDASQLVIEDQQVMQDWETPLMKAMAEISAAGHGDVLEVGFGMGISSTFIQELGVRSHTIIECNADVIARFARWRAGYPDRDIRLAEGRWQDVIDGLGQFDAVFFDTYPVTEAEFVASVIEDVTFAQHFFAAAASHLRSGGVFTYYSNEIDSFSRRHQRLLLAHFSSFELRVVQPLRPPEDCNYWWADSMVAVKAVK